MEEGGTVAERDCMVRTVRARGGFRAYRDAGASEFELLDLMPPLDPRTHWVHGEYRFMHAPYGWFGLTIPEFLKEPGMTVKGIREVKASGENLVEVSWEDAEAKAVGWFRFSPERGWVVREFAAWAKDITPEKLRSDPDYSIARGAVECREDHRQIPVMARVSYWHEREPGQPREHLETIDIEELTFGEVPEREFTLAALGIPAPELKLGTPAREVTTGCGRFLVFFAAGVLCLVAAVFLARHRKRKGA